MPIPDATFSKDEAGFKDQCIAELNNVRSGKAFLDEIKVRRDELVRKMLDYGKATPGPDNYDFLRGQIKFAEEVLEIPKESEERLLRFKNKTN